MNQGESEDEVYSRINPTLTDEEGNYVFKGLESIKEILCSI